MKYGPFLNMRFLSFVASNMNTKKPLLTKWLLIPSLIRDHKFLCTQAYTALGEGHNPVNYPISPLSARFNTALQGSSVGRATVGMESILLTNLCWVLVAGHLLHVATRSRNAASSGGRGGSSLRPPPGAMALVLRAISCCGCVIPLVRGELLEFSQKILKSLAPNHNEHWVTR